MSFESFLALNKVYQNNRFESSSDIACLGESNYGAPGICLKADTLVRLSPSFNPNTVTVGWSNYFSSYSDTLWDCVFLNGASENDIIIDEYNSDIYLFRTLIVKVLGINELPVRLSDIKVYNNYGNMIYSGITNCRGEIETGVAYKFLSGYSNDSTNYNNFNVIASKNNDIANGSIAVAFQNTILNLFLFETLGEAPGNDLEFTVADITNLINYIFHNLEQPLWERADVNLDGEINVKDIIDLINYIFKGGMEPGCS